MGGLYFLEHRSNYYKGGRDMNSRAIHETVVRDIVDILTDLKDMDQVQFLANRHSTRSFKSAASATKDLILTFPVICSSDISIENASMICKAVERKCVAMMQMLFSAISITNADNAIDYLKKFHTNINFGSDDITISGFVDTFEKAASALEAADLAEIDHDVFDEIAKELKETDYWFDESISEAAINSYRVYQNGTVTCLAEADWGGDDRYNIQIQRDLDKNKNTVDAQANIINNLRDSMKQKDEQITKLSGSLKAAELENEKHDQAKLRRDIAGAQKDMADAINKQILPTDVKKANELMPTMMIITFNQQKDGIDVPITSNAIVGIKAKLYPVSPNEIINRVRSKIQDNNWLNKFVKATTKEISFVKDFLFAIDKAKLDAMQYSKKSDSAKIWRILERRSKKSKIRRLMKNDNDASAISTLLVSQDVVEFLKKNDNIDLENPRTANSIMTSYNFMSIAICDEAVEVAKFIYDTGDDMYESISFNLLERESSDGAYKKVINLMSKMR
ncbi:MAG: hypothetical protein J6Y02_10800 [Pseudobutyrivibrio sp.]|nr:hypothetical protein [Pseudobutyrivibrio sp.]